VGHQYWAVLLLWLLAFFSRKIPLGFAIKRSQMGKRVNYLVKMELM